MATAAKTPSAGMTGAVRSLQWTIQDMNGSVEHLGQSHDQLRRAQNIMAWTTAIFGALLLSGLVWIANDIFHLKDQLMETDRRFDGMDVQMTALGTRIDDLNISIEQLNAQLLAGRGAVAPATGPVTGPDVSVLSSPNTQNFQAAANVPLETTAADAAAQPVQVQPQQAPVQQQVAAVAPAQPLVPTQPAAVAAPAVAAAPAIVDQTIAPSPPAPREQLTPAELAAPAPVIAAVAPAAAPAPAAAAPAPAAAAPAAAPAAEAQVAAAPAPAAPAAAAPAAAAPAPAAGADLSDDQLLSFNDDQIDPADELLLLDENGNPQ